jgi:hypothetical protein
VLTRRGFDDLTRTGLISRGDHGEGVATRPELILFGEHCEAVVTIAEFARRKGAHAIPGERPRETAET